MAQFKYYSYHTDGDRAVKPRIAGLFLMPLRWVTAWIFFAAAWRRLVLKPESLNPLSPEYEGIKLNHFLPHTDLLSAGLKFLILHPAKLQLFLCIFTGLEAAIGILLFLGLCSRLVSIIILGLFGNLMLVAGWLGTTCLDEWTVATLGMAFGVALFLAGSGPYSLDAFLYYYFPRLARHAWFGWLVSPELAFIHQYYRAKQYALVLSVLILGFVLYTNQHFVGGVYGPFHNPAILPHLNLSAKLTPNGELALNVYRNQGPDTYGSFIIDIKVVDANQQAIIDYQAKALGTLPDSQIKNTYLVKVKANGNALVVPLGAIATLYLMPSESIQLAAGKYTVIVTDISGLSWRTQVQI